MSRYQIDYLANKKNYKVCQDKNMYHFNTDTCLLGEYIKVKENDYVLDVGTNNGALLLYALKKKAKGVGIEISKKAFFPFFITMLLNKVKAKLIIKDFKNYQSKRKFDVIISNPPYFFSKDEKEKKKNKNLKYARHDDYLSIYELAVGISKNLKDDGKVYLVFASFRFKELEDAFNKVNLYIEEYLNVINQKGRNVSTLFTLSFGKKLKNKLNDKKI